MCRRTTCSTCQKPSWAGCGAHVEQVLAGVAIEDRCSCADGQSGGGRSWLRRLLGG